MRPECRDQTAGLREIQCLQISATRRLKRRALQNVAGVRNLVETKRTGFDERGGPWSTQKLQRSAINGFPRRRAEAATTAPPGLPVFATLPTRF